MSLTLVALLPSPSYAQCPSPSNEPATCKPPAPPGPPVPFQGDIGTSTRVRKSAFELTSVEVDRLRQAFAALRKLSEDDPDDPRGWLQQANVHCWHCGGGGASVENVHGNYWFLPWHRAYLYFFEKILGKLVGDPDLALPYWDWDTRGRSAMPPPYVVPSARSNSLFDAYRGVGPGQAMPPSATSPQEINRLLSLRNGASFMGGPAGSRQTGEIEFRIHNRVHQWVTDPTGQASCGLQDMGIFSTAAQDPIFFAHHANTDRLWELWRAMGGEQRLPADAAFRRRTWTFYDENKQWVSISVEQVLDSVGSLHYGYSRPSPGGRTDHDHATLPPLTTAPMPAPAKSIVKAPWSAQILTSEPQTVSAPIVVSSELALLEAGAPPLGPTVRRLHIDGVAMPPGGSTTVRVFVNLPGADERTPPSGPNYVGAFTIVPHHGSGHADVTRQDVAFELSAETEQVVPGSGEIPLSLVPLAGEDMRPLELTLEYQKVYVVTE
ncbi:tyrosinase family protein [Sorangium sp. So ce1128]